MSNANINRLIKNTDALIGGFEDRAIKAVESAMDASFRDLEAEFRRKWLSVESLDIGGKNRAILLIEEINQYLEILPTKSSYIQKLYEDLAKDCSLAGIALGQDSIESISGIAASTVRPNLKAIAYQSRDSADRLSRHSKDFQLRASQIIEQGLVGGSGVGKVAEMLRRELGVTKAKSETIARTESMSAMDSATRDTYQKNGIEYVQRIGTQDNRMCRYCAARVGNVYPVDKAPAVLHPRDRCFSSPFSPEWVDAGLVDMEWLRNHRAESIATLDGEPDYGPSPFERMASQSAPKPYWTVDKGFTGLTESKKAAPITGFDKLIERGALITDPIALQLKTLQDMLDTANSKFNLADIKFRREYDRLESEGKDPSEAFMAKSGIEYDIASDEVFRVKGELRLASLAAMMNIRRDLLSDQTLNPKVAKIKIDKSATSEMTEDGIRQSVDAFSRMTGGRGVGLLKEIVLTDDRAWADDETGLLNIGKHDGDAQRVSATLFHELGHFLEFSDPRIAKYAREWVKSRASGPETPLNKLIEGSTYDDTEVAYPDRFVDPYVGKIYSDGGTEVVSMGIEHFSSPQKMAELYQADKDHFNLILGILQND